MGLNILSDSWYQVADARVALLNTVRAQPQRFRGQPWVVLQDPYAHRFFRVTPQAYAFLRALQPESTVDEVWRAQAKANPDAVPGQDDVVRLLSQLHVANLLFFREQPHNDAIFERHQTQKRRERLGKWMAFLYWRIPLFSPQRLLRLLRPLVMATTGPLAALVWLAAVLAGGAALLQNASELSRAGQGLLSLSNLPWLYAALTVTKVLHEFAHAFVCTRYGGQVPVFGVMFLILAPLPYVDASASWALRSKWQRAYVGAAGMLAELFLAALAALVWTHTAEGTVNSVAFNLMVVGSVSSLLFNGNPLLRFDAYYILSDVVEMPNLYQKAQAQWLYYGSRFLLGQREAAEPATDRTERVWYTTYGALAFGYRLVVTSAVLLVVTDQWFAVGLVMLATTLVAMVALPLAGLWRHLSGPALQRGRARAVAGIGALALVVYAAVALVPLPHAVRMNGVLEAHRSEQLFVQTAGTVADLAVHHGQRLKAGALIARLDNPELRYALRTTELQLAETEAMQRHALLTSPAEVAPLQSRLDALRERQVELKAMIDRLVVRATQDGEWVAPMLHERRGAWLERGQAMGELVDRSHFRFSAVLPQSQAAELFGLHQASGEVRLLSDRGHSLAVQQVRVVPYQRERLVSPALGFSGGGEVAVRPDDSSGTLATEPFFEIQAEVPDEALTRTVAYHGMSGVLRVPVAPRPLAERGRAALQQLLQQRYAL